MSHFGDISNNGACLLSTNINTSCFGFIGIRRNTIDVIQHYVAWFIWGGIGGKSIWLVGEGEKCGSTAAYIMNN